MKRKQKIVLVLPLLLAAGLVNAEPPVNIRSGGINPSKEIGPSDPNTKPRRKQPRYDSDDRPFDADFHFVPSHQRTGKDQRPSNTAPRGNPTIIRDPAVVNDLHHHQRSEVVPGRYYWHSRQGERYCHYYDRGVHWYGFYNGPHFYWARHHGNYWWWYDMGTSRWVYWSNNRWWWTAPGGVVYIYENDDYRPSNDGPAVTDKPDSIPPPLEAPTENSDRSWSSPDGTRLVQVAGNKGEAFLYDTSAATTVFLKFIGSNVTDVKFSEGKNGKPGQILLEYKDGTFAVLTWDGTPGQ